MGKTKFEIDAAGKHTIVVNTNIFTKTLRIDLDGEKVVSEFRLVPTTKKFEFFVGNSGEHKVEVIAGMVSKPQVFVDGKAVQES